MRYSTYPHYQALTLSPRPYCQPCLWPVTLCPLDSPPAGTTFTIRHYRQAALLVNATTAQHPSWTQARVRGLVAREMGVSTVQLRYLLRQAQAKEVDALTS